MGPDWAVNLEICDILNADVWQTKDVVKAVKKRLQNKDPKVQFFALTLLETMMKNCGEYVQFEVAEQHVLQEMVKIIQKKNDMQVRDKILLLLDSWQEAFGGPGSKYPQYHWAYLEVKTTGVVFPKRPMDAPPIFTPPATHNSETYGSPRYSAGSLSDRMSSDVETLSLGDLNKIRNVTDLLNDMVYALNPSDRMAINDEIITDLVTQCRSNQQKLLQFVSSSGNEQLLKQGLETNDLLQSVLSKYDAVASGAPLAVEASVREAIEAPAVKSYAPPEHNDNVNEEEDEFAQLAQRKNKSVVSSSDDASSSTLGDLALVPIDQAVSESPSSVASNALVLLDPAPSTSTESKELDMIDLLSLTLCSPTPETSTDSSAQDQNGPQQPAVTHNQKGLQEPTVTNGQQYPSSVPQYPSNYQPHTANQAYAPQTSNYVAPWAQTGAYPPQPPAYASGYAYPAPPWVAPTHPVDSNPFLSVNYQDPRPAATSVAQTATYAPPPASYPPSISYAQFATPQSIQHSNSVASPSNGQIANQAQMNVNQQPKDSSAASSRPYYIPDNLFSDLIDAKSFGGGNKMGGPTTMGSSNGGQPMIGGKK